MRVIIFLGLVVLIWFTTSSALAQEPQAPWEDPKYDIRTMSQRDARSGANPIITGTTPIEVAGSFLDNFYFGEIIALVSMMVLGIIAYSVYAVYRKD